MIMFILTLIIVGLIAGAVARFLVPGRDPMSIPATILLGIVGSFVGGFLFNVLFGDGEDKFSTIGLLGSIVGAVIALLVYRAVMSRSGGSRRSARI